MVKPNWEDTRLKLIDTYKFLNTEVRPRGEDALSAEHGGDSVKAIVRNMKDHELDFAQALTKSLTGDTLGDDETNDPPVIGTEGGAETGAVLISQFGSARATTLNTLQSADDDAWDRAMDGGRKLHDLAQELAEGDRVYLEKIRGIIGA